MATMVNLTCNECGKKFITKLGKERKFCSKECKLKNRQKFDEKYYITKNCECCNVLFKSKIKEKKKYCSYKCSGQAKKNNSKEKRICVFCGNVFEERIKYCRKFCSEKCRNESQSKPENINKRILKMRETILNKYGVNHLFEDETVRTKALNNLRKTYKIRGSEILKKNMLKSENEKKEKLTERFGEINYKILEFKEKNIKVMHPDGHVFESNRKLLVNRLNHNVELSTVLQPIGSPRTTFERKICKFLDENNINYISNDRKIINGELDIYIPQNNLSIEINGLHWHSEYYINNDYHLNKTNMCNEKNIQLLHFFEDELIEKYDIVKSMIKSKLGIIKNKIFARKCEIREINTKTSSSFLLKNHLLGNVNASIKIGLFYKNELVSIMTFGKLRNVFGNKKIKNNEYEMLRFCNKINTIVIGGASKLYNFFKLKYKPSKVVSFANKRFTNGSLYNTLNFSFDYNTEPNYWYVVGKKRKHRLLFKKNILINEGYDIKKSEHEIMLERKIPRIYDCGNIKFINLVQQQE